MLPKNLQDWALQTLSQLVRIPSVSFLGFDPQQVKKSASAVAELLHSVGYQNVDVLSLRGCHPYVVGEFLVDPKAPTVLLYAHHDVQPPGREDLWKTPPFEPVVRDGRLFGRGSTDDKAGVVGHLAALKAFTDKSYVNQYGQLPVNLKVIIEGEEEVGSFHLLEFLNLHKERLRADVILVSDTPNIETGIPSLTIGLRGLVTVEMAVRSLKASVHSGMFGGGVVDPVQVLVKMLSKLADDEGNLLLKSTGGKARKAPENLPVGREVFARQAGVLKLESVPNDFWQRIWYEPSFSINAIQASSEKLANNIICDRAYARLGIRLAESQNAEEVQNELISRLKELAPSTVELEIKGGEPANAWHIDPQAPENKWAFSAAEDALKKGYGRDVVYMGCGASIPFIKPFQDALHAPVITLGVGDPYCLAHSENESLHLEDYFKSIESEIFMLSSLGDRWRAKG